MILEYSPEAPGNCNCVNCGGMRLQVLPVENHYHFAKAKAAARVYSDGSMTICCGKRGAGNYYGKAEKWTVSSVT